MPITLSDDQRLHIAVLKAAKAGRLGVVAAMCNVPEVALRNHIEMVEQLGWNPTGFTNDHRQKLLDKLNAVGEW